MNEIRRNPSQTPLRMEEIERTLIKHDPIVIRLIDRSGDRLEQEKLIHVWNELWKKNLLIEASVGRFIRN